MHGCELILSGISAEFGSGICCVSLSLLFVERVDCYLRRGGGGGGGGGGKRIRCRCSSNEVI